LAQIIAEVSRTFNEYLLLPNRTRTDCSVDTVDLRTPLVRHFAGEQPAIELRSPFTSAIMQAVSSPELAVALARSGGLSCLHHNQPIEDQAAAVRQVKKFKAGFITSDTNVRPGDSLWSIAASHIGPGATDAQIAAAWPRFYAANRAVVGPDPNLIYPGQRLTLPARKQPRE